MTAWVGPLEIASVALLLLALGIAAVSDLKRREVDDLLWQVVAVVGVLLGAVAVAPGGAVPLLAWLLVGGLLLQHLVAWDERLPERLAGAALLLELAGYAVVLVLVGVLVAQDGIGPSGVPWAAIATLVTIVVARLLYELGILYGFADAKALMVIGLLVPTFAAPWLGTPAGSLAVLGWMPFAITALTDAAVLSVAIPIYLAVRNAARGDFRWDRAFTCYRLATSELPQRFVWVKDPELPPEIQEAVDDAETSADDAAARARAADHLLARGVGSIWVSPQVPYVILLALGTVAALLTGNLVLDLRAIL